MKQVKLEADGIEECPKCFNRVMVYKTDDKELTPRFFTEHYTDAGNENSKLCKGLPQQPVSEANHTPTPWAYDYMYTHDIITKSEHRLDILAVASCVLKNHKGDECGEDEINKANAAFIVRAVNAHDELTSVLHRVYTDLLANGEFNSSPWVRELRAEVLAALAKAENRGDK